MEICNSCQAAIAAGTDHCPLCGTVLEKKEAEQWPPAVNHYPNLERQMTQYNFFFKLLLFLTLFGCVFLGLVNLLATPGVWWCLIVYATALYCWAFVPPMLRRGTNFARQILFQVILISIIVVAADFITGYKGWSVNYVVPGVLSAGILATGLMAAFNRTRWSQFVFYQVLVGGFGFVPLLLYALRIAESLVMVLVTVGLALASLLLTAVFADRSIKNEFIKRFHI